MASIKRPDGNRIHIDDPAKEPEPPKLDTAGELGPVGEDKQQERDLAYKDGTWRDGPASESVPKNKPPR